jgi:hypothetical protein
MGKFSLVNYLQFTLVAPGESQERVQTLVEAIARDVKASIHRHVGIGTERGYAERVVLGTGPRHIASILLKLTPVIQEGTRQAAERTALRHANELARELERVFRTTYGYELAVRVEPDPTDDALARVV